MAHSKSPRYAIRHSGQLANQLIIVRDILKTAQNARIYAPYFEINDLNHYFSGLKDVLVSYTEYAQTPEAYTVIDSIPKDYTKYSELNKPLSPYFKLAPESEVLVEKAAQALLNTQAFNIAIHYRGKDFKMHSFENKLAYQPLSVYLQKLQSYLEKSAPKRELNVIVFSDESFCKPISFQGHPIHLARTVTQGDPILDLYLMARCDVIICNPASSYAYWAHYMGENQRITITLPHQNVSAQDKISYFPERLRRKLLRELKKIVWRLKNRSFTGP